MSKKVLYLGLNPTHYTCDGLITHWPIIKIAPRPLSDSIVYNSLMSFECYSHVIITSKTTIEILNEYLTSLDLNNWSTKTVIVVGKITAEYFPLVCKKLIIAENETAEGITEVLDRLQLDAAHHLFWAHSSEARPVIKNYLDYHQLNYTHCDLYDPKPTDVQEKPSLEKFDEIVFTSPSTVDAFFSIFGKFPHDINLTSIGPITAKYLETRRSCELDKIIQIRNTEPTT